MTSAPDHTNGTYFLSKLPCGLRIGSTIFKMNLFVVNYGNIRAQGTFTQCAYYAA